MDIIFFSNIFEQFFLLFFIKICPRINGKLTQNVFCFNALITSLRAAKVVVKKNCLTER